MTKTALLTIGLWILGNPACAFSSDQVNPFRVMPFDWGILTGVYCNKAGVDPDDPEVMKKLLQIAAGGSYHQRLAAVQAIGEFREGGPIVIELLRSIFEAEMDEELGDAAAISLGEIASERNASQPILLRGLKSKEGRIRSRAAIGLGEIREPNRMVLKALLRALRDDEPRVQLNAAKGFRHLGQKAKPALPELTKSLQTATGLTAVELALAVGFAAPTEASDQAIMKLVDALKSTDIQVRIGAIDALERFGWLRECIGCFRDDRQASDKENASESRKPCLEATVNALADLAADHCVEVRLAAIRAIGAFHCGDDESISAFMAALKDSDANVRSQAAFGLGISSPAAKAALPALRHAAKKDAAGAVRVSAAKALWCMEGSSPEWVTVILSVLEDKADSEGHFFAVLALERVGKDDSRTIPALKQALKDSDGAVRAVAKSALKAMEKKKER